MPPPNADVLPRDPKLGHDVAHAVGNLWHGFTSALENAWHNVVGIVHHQAAGNGGGDGDQNVVVVTEYSTSTPPGYTGPLQTIYGAAPTAAATSSEQMAIQTPAPALPSPPIASITSDLAAQPTGDLLPLTIIPSSQSIDSTLAIAPSAAMPTAPLVTPEPLPGDTTAASANNNKANDDESAGVKVGIALGVIGAIVLATVALFWFFNRRRKRMEERKEQEYYEKREPQNPESLNPFADSISARRPVSSAPRLGLASPVTSMFPDELAHTGPHPERRASRGAALSAAMSAANPQLLQSLRKPLPGMGMPGAAQHPSEKQDASSSFFEAAPTNPFDTADQSHEESVRASSPKPRSSRSGSAVSAASAVTAASWPGHDAGATTAVAPSAGLVRKTSLRKKDMIVPIDLTKPVAPGLSGAPASPVASEYSMQSASSSGSVPTAGAAAIAAAGGPTATTVHRVQLDFKPTLGDELGLRAGQLVRLLHEYDDGWALCIRLDRSEQGVVPRSCLSTRPVKPRSPPSGPPRGPPMNADQNRHGRAMTPRGGPQQRRQESPMGPGQASTGRRRRPSSPGIGPGPRQPSQSPGRSRNQSPGGLTAKPARHSPTRPSPMNQEYRPSENPASSDSLRHAY